MIEIEKHAPLSSIDGMVKPPNIIIVHCHDLGHHLGCYGITSVVSPHLDAFAGQGVRFSNSFCTAPSCSPSRAALFTGRYPHSNGVMGLCHASFAWDLHPGERHLAQLLKEAGYRTAAIGTLHETRAGAARVGYDTFDGHYRATEATDRAVAFLRDQRGDAPFYLSVGYFEPHRMGAANDPLGEHDFIGGYLQPDASRGITVPGYLSDTDGTRRELAELQGAIRHVDTQFGRLMQTLDACGLAANSLVVFTADHGIAMPRAKCSLYDPGIEVALLIRWPQRPGWTGGRVLTPLISNIDVVPTLLDAAGVATPEAVQGLSFAGLLDGRAYEPRAEIFAEMTYHDYYDPRRCIRTASHKLIANFTTAPAFMDPSQRWRPRSDTVTPRNHALAYHEPLEFYDLRADPWEQQDLVNAPEHEAIRRELVHRLMGHLQTTSDPILAGAVTNPLAERALQALRVSDAGCH